MKKLINSFIVGMVLAISTVLSPVALAADTSGIALPGVSGLDNPKYISQTWKAGTDFSSTAITNGSQILFTNKHIYIHRNEPVSLTIGGAWANSTGSTNAVTAYFDLSFDGGRNFTVSRPLSFTFNGAANATLARPWVYIPYTNMAGAQVIRLTAISNAIPAAATPLVSFWPTNITFATRPGEPR